MKWAVANKLPAGFILVVPDCATRHYSDHFTKRGLRRLRDPFENQAFRSACATSHRGIAPALPEPTAPSAALDGSTRAGNLFLRVCEEPRSLFR
jgi:hypothetical protein